MNQRVFLLLLFATGCRLVAGDTLVSKDGQVIEGRYLAATRSSVQFEVDGKPYTYATWLIHELRFHPGAAPSAPPPAAYTGPRGKAQQDRFCEVLHEFVQARNKVSAEPNPIRRAQLPPPDPWSFEDSIAPVFGPNGEFVDWTGRLFFSVTGSNVVLTFQPTCGAGSAISFTNGYPVDARPSAHAARIPLSSPLAEKLREASPGGVYRVSGHLIARTSAGETHVLGSSAENRTDARQHFESSQANGVANVTNPQYLVQFTEATSAGH